MSTIDVWLRGDVEGIDPLLQPVAHALLQAMEDIDAIATQLTEDLVWKKPGDAAPIGYHFYHMTGSTDRLFTYARGEELNEQQVAALKDEKRITELKPPLEQLLDHLRKTIDRAIAQLRTTNATELKNRREVGRAKLPSTVIGLLFHAAEHARRHAGQITTTLLTLR